MSTTMRINTDTGERPLPPGVIGGWAVERRKTRETAMDHERVRRFTTLEVRWDQGIERLTIDDVQIDDCLDVAARIMEVLPYDRFELDTVDAETIRYRILEPSWRLRTAVFLKKSLQRLATDPDRAIKIEYLQRDLVWSTQGRRSYVYPSALRNQIG